MTTLLTEHIARRTRQLSEVDSTLVTIADTDLHRPNIGRVYAHLVDPRHRGRAQHEVMAQVRNDIADLIPAGTRMAEQEVNDMSLGGQNAAVAYVISGPDQRDADRAGPRACSVARCRARRPHAYPIDLVGGVEASTFEDKGDQYPVFLRSARAVPQSRCARSP